MTPTPPIRQQPNQQLQVSRLAQAHQDAMHGREPRYKPRIVVQESWRRLQAQGVRPDKQTWMAQHMGQEVANLESRNVMQLHTIFPRLSQHVAALTEGDETIVAFTDASARIVSLQAGTRMRALAERLGMSEGALWNESTVGTNAIGTCLINRQPTQIFGPEHFCYNQHGWSCAAAPIVSPRTGKPIGVIDVSMPLERANPRDLSLVALLAHTANLELRERHHQDLLELKSSTWSRTKRLRGTWAVVDRDGWIADQDGFSAERRVRLPELLPGAAGGCLVVPGLGVFRVEEVPGGWILRSDAARSELPARETLLTIAPSGAGAIASLEYEGHVLNSRLSRRQRQILWLLAEHPVGMSAAELSVALYGEDTHLVAIRAEISRIRRRLGDVLAANPYRFVPGTHCVFAQA